MTSRDVTDEQLGQLSRKQHDLFRRVREGTLPIDDVLKGLQTLIEGGEISFKSKERHFRGKKYPVMVEYNPPPSYAELCEMFDWVGRGLTWCMFERIVVTKDIPRHPRTIEFRLVRLYEDSCQGGDWDLDHILEEFLDRKLRPAIFEELLDFAKTYPDLQREVSICATGSIDTSQGEEEWRAPFLTSSSEGSTVGLDEVCINEKTESLTHYFLVAPI